MTKATEQNDARLGDQFQRFDFNGRSIGVFMPVAIDGHQTMMLSGGNAAMAARARVVQSQAVMRLDDLCHDIDLFGSRRRAELLGEGAPAALRDKMITAFAIADAYCWRIALSLRPAAEGSLIEQIKHLSPSEADRLLDEIFRDMEHPRNERTSAVEAH